MVKNGSKIRRCTSAGIPGPLSKTSRITWLWSAWAAVVRVRQGESEVYLIEQTSLPDDPRTQYHLIIGMLFAALIHMMCEISNRNQIERPDALSTDEESRLYTAWIGV